MNNGLNPLFYLAEKTVNFPNIASGATYDQYVTFTPPSSYYLLTAFVSRQARQGLQITIDEIVMSSGKVHFIVRGNFAYSAGTFVLHFVFVKQGKFGYQWAPGSE